MLLARMTRAPASGSEISIDTPLQVIIIIIVIIMVIMII